MGLSLCLCFAAQVLRLLAQEGGQIIAQGISVPEITMGYEPAKKRFGCPEPRLEVMQMVQWDRSSPLGWFVEGAFSGFIERGTVLAGLLAIAFDLLAAAFVAGSWHPSTPPANGSTGTCTTRALFQKGLMRSWNIRRSRLSCLLALLVGRRPTVSLGASHALLVVHGLVAR